jgi:hypothetical protein
LATWNRVYLYTDFFFFHLVTSRMLKINKPFSLTAC